ncbi:MAG TPA: acetate--CoA ligase family protein, partial [Solirubrobacteraceae bacterium]
GRWCTALERCARAGVGVAVLKAGSSPAGAAAARSHTGALAGDQRVVRALFEECGALWARAPHELLEFAKALAVTRRVEPRGGGERAGPVAGRGEPRGGGEVGGRGEQRGARVGAGPGGGRGGSRVAVMTCSGGDASVAADRAQRLGVPLPALAPATVGGLRAVLPAVATAENPLDYTALLWDEPAKLGRIVDVLAADPSVDRVLVFYDDASEADASWAAVLDAVREAGARAAVPVAVASTLPELLGDASAARLQADGVAAIAGLETALRCLRALSAPSGDPSRIAALRAAATRGGGTGDAAGIPAARGEGPADAAGISAGGGGRPADAAGISAGDRPDGWLAEHEAKALLGAAGLPVVPGRLVADAEDAVAARHELGGAVALKRSEPGLLHKAAAGAVEIGLASDDSVRAAYARLGAGTLLAERMAPPGVELIVAARRGLVPALVVGLGGAWAELLDDVAVIPLPATPPRVERALRSLRGAARLQRIDVPAVARLAARAGELLLEAGLHEIELNPVLAYPDGALAVDALARRTNEETR